MGLTRRMMNKIMLLGWPGAIAALGVAALLSIATCMSVVPTVPTAQSVAGLSPAATGVLAGVREFFTY
jgi:hypothetical protein